MKKSIVFVLIFFFTFASSQKISFESDLQIYYEIIFRPDSTNSRLVTNTVALYEGKNKSIFQDSNRYKIDSMIQQQKMDFIPNLPMFSVNHIIYKDLDQSEITYSENVATVNLGYKESIKSLKWQLLGGKKTILNHECYEAKINLHGRNYTAWYTKDIPISDGPYKFAGLPGLVLEIYDSENNFHYNAIAITKKKMNIVYDESIKYTERIKLRDAKIDNIVKNSKNEIKLNPMELK